MFNPLLRFFLTFKQFVCVLTQRVHALWMWVWMCMCVLCACTCMCMYVCVPQHACEGERTGKLGCGWGQCSHWWISCRGVTTHVPCRAESHPGQSSWQAGCLPPGDSGNNLLTSPFSEKQRSCGWGGKQLFKVTYVGEMGSPYLTPVSLPFYQKRHLANSR